jgi:hypothetical protein
MNPNPNVPSITPDDRSVVLPLDTNRAMPITSYRTHRSICLMSIPFPPIYCIASIPILPKPFNPTLFQRALPFYQHVHVSQWPFRRRRRRPVPFFPRVARCALKGIPGHFRLEGVDRDIARAVFRHLEIMSLLSDDMTVVASVCLCAPRTATAGARHCIQRAAGSRSRGDWNWRAIVIVFG